MEKNREKRETAPNIRAGWGWAHRSSPAEHQPSSGPQEERALLLNDDFYCNNLLPSASSLASNPFLRPAENAFFCAAREAPAPSLPFSSPPSQPNFFFFSPCLAGKGEEIPSRFAVYRVVFNTSESIQQAARRAWNKRGAGQFRRCLSCSGTRRIGAWNETQISLCRS